MVTLIGLTFLRFDFVNIFSVVLVLGLEDLRPFFNAERNVA